METFNKIRENNSSNKKQELLKEMSDMEELILRYTFDNSIVFNVKDKVIMKVLNINSIEGFEDIGEYLYSKDTKLNTISEPSYPQIKDFLDKAKKYTGKQLEEHISNFCRFESNIDIVVWCLRCLLKDLRLGMAKTSVNKVLISLGKEPIKQHVVQLAKRTFANNGEFYYRKDKEYIENKDIIFPCIVETKKDGLRLWASIEIGQVSQGNGLMSFGDTKQDYIIKLTTRQDEDATPYLPEIVENLREWAKLNNITNPTILDGEGFDEFGFNDLQKRLQRKPENIIKTNSIKFCVFDIVKFEGTDLRNLDFEKRSEYRNKLVYNEGVNLIDYKLVNNYEELIDYYNIQINNKEEGIIIKNLDSLYAIDKKNERKGFFKLKPEEEGTFEIYNITEGTGRNAGKLSVLHVKDRYGNLVSKVGTGLNDDDINFITEKGKDFFIGKFCDVSYQEVSYAKEVKSLRFPAFKCWREDKEECDSY